MKKFGFIIMLLVLTIGEASAQYYDYYIDRKYQEKKQERLAEKEKRGPVTFAGIITRAGYAFNYDAVTYGASLVYKTDGIFGITAGFDGYYIPNKMIYRESQNDTVPSSTFSMPLWDVRLGFFLTQYFAFGGLCGKSNINDATNLINMRQDAWFINNSESNVMYGGFVTFILPVSKYCGFNVDFAVTNKTGFNIAAGINLTIPVK